MIVEQEDCSVIAMVPPVSLRRRGEHLNPHVTAGKDLI